MTALDRCDYADCPSQAYIKAIGVSGDLLFCAHHWTKIMNSDLGAARMEQFAFNIIDERDKLIENRLIGEDR